MAKGKQKLAGPSQTQYGSNGNQITRPPILHGDLYQRANFTLQASAFLQQLPKSATLLDRDAGLNSETESERTGQDADMSRLSRNMMAANGKMVVHNQMKLSVYPLSREDNPSAEEAQRSLDEAQHLPQVLDSAHSWSHLTGEEPT